MSEISEQELLDMKSRLSKKKNVLNLIRTIQTRGRDSIFMMLVAEVIVVFNTFLVIFFDLPIIEFICSLTMLLLVTLSFYCDVKTLYLKDLFYFLQSEYYSGNSNKGSFNIINSQNGHAMFKTGRIVCMNFQKKATLHGWIFSGLCLIFIVAQITMALFFA